MKCAKCGLRYAKEEAAMQFDDHFNGLDYESEITLGSHECQLCGDCAIDYMEAKIRSQPGYVEDEAEDDDFDEYEGWPLSPEEEPT